MKHIDWEGVPIVDYCCYNSFAVGLDETGDKFKGYQALEMKNNTIHAEMKKREMEKAGDH